MTKASYLYEPGGQPPLEAQLQALTMEQMEERLRSLGRAAREVSPQELFDLDFKEKRRRELLASLLGYPRAVRRLRGLPVASEALLPLLQRLPWDGNQRPAVRASGYMTLKARGGDRLAAEPLGAFQRPFGSSEALERGREAVVRGRAVGGMECHCGDEGLPGQPARGPERFGGHSALEKELLNCF